MSLSLYEASIPVYLQMLRNLAALLDKAEAHAKAEGRDPDAYAGARLIEDMHPLNRQIHMASDAAKGGAARLAGLAPPSFPDVETTFPELRERIGKTIAFVESVKPEQVNGREEATIELPLPNRTLTFTGRDFLLKFSLPNFFFHVTTAYALLRKEGVPLGKLDYLAGAVPLAQAEPA
ncbi:conserved hypothetical protein [Phenylobacterium zucineum HLK1]|uniref:DUF1993 domain-containing protein n=1 Tax=Phenylobacterium zucineum (strain HLK1) TaxID=450851 RepID=B4RE25_PHEZH|nr:DUF1993 domain-containing protein [Phenylobacterium zucineum]ACG78458.1 conserved hypothetical protein [Phenylobacterium zucineum HLK1]